MSEIVNFILLITIILYLIYSNPYLGFDISKGLHILVHSYQGKWNGDDYDVTPKTTIYTVFKRHKE